MMQCLLPSTVDSGVLFTALIALGILSILSWIRRQAEFFGKRHFEISLMAMVLWLSGCMFEMSQTSLECRMFWAGASWPFIVLLPTAWSMFLLEYCSPGVVRRHHRLRQALLVGGPVIAALIVATNPLHRLFYGPMTQMVRDGGRMVVVYDHGPLFFLLAAYLYFFLSYALFQTLRGVFWAERRFRLFFVGLFIITAIPGVANLAYIGFGVTVMGFDPTPFAFSVVLTLLAWMVVSNRIMDLAAVAQHVLFHSMTDPVIVIGPEGHLVEVNAEAQKLIGRSLPPGGLEIAQVPWLFPAINSLAVSTPTGRAMVTVAGRQFSVSFAPLARPIGQGHGAIGWVMRMHDLTAHLQLEADFAVQRDAMASLMQVSLSGLIGLDREGVFVAMNAEAERIIGASLGTPGGLRIDDPAWDIQTPRGTPIDSLDRLLRGFVKSGQPVWDERLSFIRRSDGARRILSLNAMPLAQETRMRTSLALSIVDVTERYLAEIRLRDAAERAEAANRAKSQFLANMSHEIRTPLNGVLGMADVLADRLEDEDHKRMAEAIRDSGELLLALLNDILDMAKIEAGKLVLEEAPFQPQAIAARLDTLFRQQAATKGLDYTVLVGASAAAGRIGDSLRVQQIVQNLISNAIKFTAEGEVRVEFGTDAEGALLIEVSDTGIGMTAEQCARIFDEFEQADGSTTRRFGGTGLGMSIIRRLTDLMDGQAHVISQPGLGTSVRVTLPLPRAEG